ncbi:hypothetical protein CR513_02106, partial [Mucuna pruriens]
MLSAEGMKCPSSQLFFAKLLMYELVTNEVTSATAPWPLYLRSMEWCTESPLCITLKPMAKLKLLQKMANPSRNDWSRLLEDPLWAHRTTYQTLLGIAIWPTTKPSKTGNYSYRNWKSYTWRLLRTSESTRKTILRKEFKIGQMLKLIVGKLRSRLDWPFIVTDIFPYRAVEVNGHQLKPYHEGLILSSKEGEVEVLMLIEHVIPEGILEEIPESMNA